MELCYDYMKLYLVLIFVDCQGRKKIEQNPKDTER